MSECGKLAQREYKQENDCAALHSGMCVRKGFECSDKWYEYHQDGVVEDDDCTVLYFKILTDRQLEHKRAEMVIIDKKKKSVSDNRCGLPKG